MWGVDSGCCLVPVWVEISLKEIWNIVGGTGDTRQVWVRVPRKLPHR